ncbi:tetratricopeptide repeat protein [Brachyspira hampsonii]|uniref:tetratricopeptide repeat protein n=1 Tax=Brachyspira hampsonii TaxID=1287055 RepID=UPI002159D712|nr:tetratricopeptide repeat protein [Brachyspira hampsonii]
MVQYDDSYIDDEYKKVIATLKKLLNLNYKKDKVLYYLAASYYYDSDYDNKKIQKKIIELLENAIELNNKDSEYWYLLGKVHFFVIKDYDKAIEFHKKAAEINYTETICNNKEYYYYTLGKINLYLGKSQEAIENFKKAIKDSIDYFNDFYEVSDYWHYLGLSYEKNGQYDEALKSYKKALNIDLRSELDDYFYDCLNALKSLYDLYKKLGKNDDAIYTLKDSIEKDISAPFMIIPFDDEDFKGSETYNDIVQAYNDSWHYCHSAAAYREMLAAFYTRYGEYDKAIELYNQISIENYKNIAETYIKAKNYKKAIDTYKMIIKMYPDNELNCYIDIARTYEEAENYEEVVNYYNKAIEIDSGNSEYYVNIAEIYKKLENYEEAVNYYNKAIEILNEPCKYHEKLAECYERLGKYNNAIEAYKEYFKIADDILYQYILYINGSKLDILKKIASLYDKLNDIENRNLYYEKAIEKYRELIKKYKRREKEYLEKTADIYIKIGNKEKAFEIYNDLIKKYSKEISRNKNNCGLFEIQADLYLKIDDKESALETYNKAIEVCLKKIKSFENKEISNADNDDENKISSYMEDLSYLAFFYQKVSKPENCINIYEKLIKIYEENITDNEESTFYLESIAELYIKLNQKDNALKTYKRILEIDKYNNDAKEKIEDIESGKEVKTACIFGLLYNRYK